MTGSGPAGETTMADIRARLRSVTERMAGMADRADTHAEAAVTDRRAGADGAGGDDLAT